MFNWVKELRRFGLVAIICCVTLALSSTAAHAQTFNITNLTSDTASKASYPTMVVERDGNLDLAWVDSSTGIKFVHSTTSASGTSFGSPVVPTIIPNSAPPALPAFQPQMAVYMTQPYVIEIAWAALAPASTTAAPLYDVFAS